MMNGQGENEHDTGTNLLGRNGSDYVGGRLTQFFCKESIDRA
jgi:hypothetical protein